MSDTRTVVDEVVLETPVILDIPEKPIKLRRPGGGRKPGKAKAKATKPVAKTVKAKRGPGRPRVYKTAERQRIAKYLRRYGLTKGIERLAGKGLKVSLTTANAVATEEGITFTRGRPSKAA